MTATLAITLKLGDAEAFRRLVRRHGEALLRQAISILDDPAAAQDVVQQTFIRIWQSRERLPDELMSLESYCFRVMLNLARNAQRDRALRFERESEAMQRRATPGAWTSGDSGPMHNAMANEAWQLVEQLPASLRDVMVLRFGLSMTQTETADRLQVPTGTVVTRQRRALDQLRGRMATWAGVSLPALGAVDLLASTLSGARLREPSITASLATSMENLVMKTVIGKSGTPLLAPALQGAAVAIAGLLLVLAFMVSAWEPIADDTTDVAVLDAGEARHHVRMAAQPEANPQPVANPQPGDDESAAGDEGDADGDDGEGEGDDEGEEGEAEEEEEVAAGALHGRVTDSRGAPVSGAIIRVRRWHEEEVVEEHEQRTDDDGAWRFDSMSRGGWAVYFGAGTLGTPRLAMTARELNLGTDDREMNITLLDAPRVIVTVELDGEWPADGVRGRLIPERGHWQFNQFEAPDGYYGDGTLSEGGVNFTVHDGQPAVIEGLPLRDYRVTVVDTGLSGIDRTTGMLRAGAEHAITLRVRAGLQFEVSVMHANGRPVREATILALSANGNGPVRRAWTGDNGRAVVGGLSAGRYLLSVTHPDGGSWHGETDLTGGSSSALVSLDPGYMVSGTVTGPEGPVQGGEVDARRVLADGSLGERHGTRIRAGRYQLNNLQPGSYRVSADAEGLSVRAVSLDVRAPRETLNLRLQTAWVVDGRVLDEEGNAVAGANLILMHYNAEQDAWYGQRTHSDDEGRYEFDGRAERDSVLRVDAPGHIRQAIPLTLAGSIERDVTLVKRNSATIVRIRNTEGEAQGGFRVVIRTDTDPAAPLHRDEVGEQGVFDVTGLSGRYIVELYRFNSFSYERWPEVMHRTTIDVPAEEGTHEIEMIVNLPSLHSVSGRIVAGEVSAQAVWLQNADGRRLETLVEGGRFHFNRIPPGTYTVWASGRDSTWSPQLGEVIVVDSNISELEIDATGLVTGGRVFGVADGSAAATAGFRVGDVITAIAGHAVHRAADVAAILELIAGHADEFEGGVDVTVATADGTETCTLPADAVPSGLEVHDD